MFDFLSRWGPVLFLPLFMWFTGPPAPELPADWEPAPLAGSWARPKRDAARAPLRGVLNVNQASLAELQLLPGIGPRLAKAILKEGLHRPYEDLSQLTRVRGIGPKKAQRWAKHLSFHGETTLARAHRPPPPPTLGSKLGSASVPVSP